MKKSTKWIIAITALLVVIAIIRVNPLRGVFTVDRSVQNKTASSYKATVFKCPESYNNKDEYNKDLQLFIADYSSKYPNATVGDFQAYRTSVLAKNNCQQYGN